MNFGIPPDVRNDVQRILMRGGTFPDLKMDSPLTIAYATAGSGKTRWAAWVAMQGEGWYFCNARDIMDVMRGFPQKDEHGARKIEKAMKELPRLIIDDLSDEEDSRFAKYKSVFIPLEIFRKVLMARCSSDKRTIITTNIKPERLAERYDHDKKKSDRGRIFSRFCDHTRIYKFKGCRRRKEAPVQKERTYLDEGVKEGPNGEEIPKARIVLKDRQVVTIPLYLEPEKDPVAGETTEAEVKKCLKNLLGKEGLEAAYYKGIKDGKFKHLIPEVWHERARAREKAAESDGKERERLAKVRADLEKQRVAKGKRGVPTGANDTDTDSVPGGDERGTDAGVDSSGVPNWGGER